MMVNIAKVLEAMEDMNMMGIGVGGFCSEMNMDSESLREENAQLKARIATLESQVEMLDEKVTSMVGVLKGLGLVSIGFMRVED